jgi:uncharacterized protein YmfQ (DUF2313 family)
MSDVDFVDLATDAAGDTLRVNPGGDSLLAYIVSAAIPAPPPIADQAAYLFALQALMPRGRAWPKFPEAIQTRLLNAIAAGLARLSLAISGLISDAFPATSINLLTEWELSLGLPDPCAGESPVLQVRQAEVAAKFAYFGGQSVPFFIALAKRLGYIITITEFKGAQAHHWQVNAPGVAVIYFRAGISSAGDPLIIGGNAVLECIFNELKPAHTTVSFNYSPEG